MNDKVDWFYVVMTPVSAVALCALTYAWADNLSNSALAIGTAASFFSWGYA